MTVWMTLVNQRIIAWRCDSAKSQRGPHRTSPSPGLESVVARCMPRLRKILIFATGGVKGGGMLGIQHCWRIVEGSAMAHARTESRDMVAVTMKNGWRVPPAVWLQGVPHREPRLMQRIIPPREPRGCTYALRRPNLPIYAQLPRRTTRRSALLCTSGGPSDSRNDTA